MTTFKDHFMQIERSNKIAQKKTAETTEKLSVIFPNI